MARRKAGEAVPVVGPECTWLLGRMAASVTVPRRTAERAAIFLGAAAGRTDRSIASEVGRSRDTVSRWRRRFADAAPPLMAAEESLAKEGADRRKTLRAPGESLEMLLDDLPRAGAPPKYGPEARANAI